MILAVVGIPSGVSGAWSRSEPLGTVWNGFRWNGLQPGADNLWDALDKDGDTLPAPRQDTVRKKTICYGRRGHRNGVRQPPCCKGV
jgi:hypothetical protein